MGVVSRALVFKNGVNNWILMFFNPNNRENARTHKHTHAHTHTTHTHTHTHTHTRILIEYRILIETANINRNGEY